MPQMMNDAAFRAYAIACSILVFKMFAAGILTATTRTRVKQFLNPEDARMSGGAGVKEEHPEVLRTLRLHRNDLENILPFFTVALIFVLMGASAFAVRRIFILLPLRGSSTRSLTLPSCSRGGRPLSCSAWSAWSGCWCRF
jgi:hypothetical protein